MLFYPFRTKGSLSPRKEVILLPKPPQDCLCYLDYVETTGVGGVVQKISDFIVRSIGRLAIDSAGPPFNSNKGLSTLVRTKPIASTLAFIFTPLFPH